MKLMKQHVTDELLAICECWLIDGKEYFSLWDWRDTGVTAGTVSGRVINIYKLEPEWGFDLKRERSVRQWKTADFIEKLREWPV